MNEQGNRFLTQFLVEGDKISDADLVARIKVAASALGKGKYEIDRVTDEEKPVMDEANIALLTMLPKWQTRNPDKSVSVLTTLIAPDVYKFPVYSPESVSVKRTVVFDETAFDQNIVSVLAAQAAVSAAVVALQKALPDLNPDQLKAIESIESASKQAVDSMIAIASSKSVEDVQKTQAAKVAMRKGSPEDANSETD